VRGELYRVSDTKVWRGNVHVPPSHIIHVDRSLHLASRTADKAYCKVFYSMTSLKDRTCFPWFVCEWKHHGKVATRDKRELYCQAANGSAVCLTLLANAAAGGESSPALDDIRPIVSMTFTGPETKVWLAYVTRIQDGRYRYVSVSRALYR
jgi:hypothetical protein